MLTGGEPQGNDDKTGYKHTETASQKQNKIKDKLGDVRRMNNCVITSYKRPLDLIKSRND